jgi:predicted RNase H-like HicB family nuclease
MLKKVLGVPVRIWLDDELYRAEVLQEDMAGVSAEGETFQEAMDEIKQAVRHWKRQVDYMSNINEIN